MNNLSKHHLQNILTNISRKAPSFAEKLSMLKILNQKIKPLLEPMLAAQCVVANFDSSCLFLQVSNAAFATRLRYQLPELLVKLRHIPELRTIEQIRYFVAPDVKPISSASYAKAVAISPESAAMIKQTAENITDENLRKALHQLALRVQDE